MEPQLCTCCGKPLNEVIYESRLRTIETFYNQAVPDLTKFGYFAHRICWITTIDTSFKAVDPK